MTFLRFTFGLKQYEWTRGEPGVTGRDASCRHSRAKRFMRDALTPALQLWTGVACMFCEFGVEGTIQLENYVTQCICNMQITFSQMEHVLSCLIFSSIKHTVLTECADKKRLYIYRFISYYQNYLDCKDTSAFHQWDRTLRVMCICGWMKLPPCSSMDETDMRNTVWYNIVLLCKAWISSGTWLKLLQEQCTHFH